LVQSVSEKFDELKDKNFKKIISHLSFPLSDDFSDDLTEIWKKRISLIICIVLFWINIQIQVLKFVKLLQHNKRKIRCWNHSSHLFFKCNWKVLFMLSQKLKIWFKHLWVKEGWLECFIEGVIDFRHFFMHIFKNWNEFLAELSF